MADEAPQMHKDFPRWYATLEVGPDTDRRAARWAGVDAVVSKADRATVEALVRIAFASRQPPAGHSLTRIQEAYRFEDETFEPAKAAREMEVLAGACLAVLFDRGGDLGAAAALSVASASFAGGRAPNLPMELTTLAENALERMADGNRTRPALAGLAIEDSPKVDFEAAGVKAQEETGEALAAAFTLAANSVRTAMRTLATRQARAIRAVDRFIQVQDEELQMLWWLTGGRSWDFDCAFDAVTADAQPLVFAKELADSTTFLPGPRSVKPLLVRAGLKERKKLTIGATVNAADAKWLAALVEDANPSPVTEPMHFAVKRQVEAGGGEAWIAGWAAVVGVDGGRSLSALALGTQFYRERLLALFE
jgi:hypothetical protein